MASSLAPSSLPPAGSPAATTLLYLDCFAGIAGDMLTGALVHLIEERAEVEPAWNAVLEQWRAALDALELDDTKVEIERVSKRGIHARKLRVHHHEHHPHRGLSDVLAILERGARSRAEGGPGLTSGALERARRAFTALAEAEAAVHDTTVDKVHFHEVGAVDAIVDIASASILLDALAPDRILASAVRTGFGTVTCAHGVMPVPAPATARLLRGIPAYAGDVEAECATPTGAALLLANVDGYGPAPAMRAEAIGYGAGDKDMPHANAVRAVFAREDSPSVASSTVEATAIEWDEETLVTIETHVDDMTGEDLGALSATLLDREQGGAVDVTFTPATGKKSRPTMWIRVLTRPENERRTLEVLFRHSTTLGARVREERRVFRPRDEIDVKTPFGEIRGKRVQEDDNERFFPEADDCVAAAQRAGVAVATVRGAAVAAFNEILGGK